MSKPVLLSRQLVNKALADDSFYYQMPEFKELKNRSSDAGKLKATRKHGCKSCRERRKTNNMFGGFLAVMNKLGPTSTNRLKQYFGVEKLMFSSRDPNTGGYATRIV